MYKFEQEENKEKNISYGMLEYAHIQLAFHSSMLVGGGTRRGLTM
jgi:hypothetical protein